MARSSMLLAALLLACGEPAAERAPARDANERWPGGETSVEDTSVRAFSLPARNLDDERRGHFAVGNNLFADNWVTAPSSTSARDGLGPLFDATSCSGCHLHDGRGRIEADGSIVSAVVRLGHEGGPHPIYGSQLQRRALLGLEPDGDVRMIRVPLDPLSEVGLAAPVPMLELRHGAEDGLTRSVRVAPHLVGMGLLEAIEEASILAHVDREDANHDGIRGHANRVMDLRRGAPTLGRFGWKGNQPTVEQQIVSALAGDLGITSTLIPETECRPDDQACLEAPNGGAPEISDALLAFLVTYMRTLAVPASRDFEDPVVLRGHGLFRRVGCDGCHVPGFTTGDSDIPALAHQRIFPYSDLLLHDMGEALADHRPDGLATGREWRTPPLWGLGLIETVNGHLQLLHDGRAAGIDEAIRWHGGEAEGARQRYEALSEEERAALVRFVASI